MIKSALVTGSTGFIGSHLCRRLAKMGIAVRAFHRTSSPLTLLEGIPVEHFIGDITRPETIKDAVRGVDAVFHCASRVGVEVEPGILYAAVVEGTRFILRAALEARVQRLVYTSSIAALGIPEKISPGTHPPPLLDENHTLNYQAELWPYGYAKYLAEQEVQHAVARGLDAVIVNPAFVYGPGDIYRQRRSMVTQVARGQMQFIFDGGMNVVHIRDVVDAHIAALEKGAAGQRYIIGGENLTIRDMVEIIAAVADVEPPKLILPVGVVRLFARLINRFGSYLNIPPSSFPLQLAGCHLFYNLRKAQTRLNLDTPILAIAAVRDSYQWFKEIGALPSGPEQ